MHPTERSEPSHHFLGALIDLSVDVDVTPLTIPSLLHLVPVLQFHTGDAITDGRGTLRQFNRVRKPLVRIARWSGVTGRIGRTFRGTFVRAQGGKTDLAADGTNDGLG